MITDPLPPRWIPLLLIWIFLLHFVRVNDLSPCIVFQILFLMIVLPHCLIKLPFSISNMSIAKSFQGAVQYSERKQALDKEMDTLLSHQTWELVHSSPKLFVVSYRWVFTVKYRPDDIVDRYKPAWLLEALLIPIKWIVRKLLLLLGSIPSVFCSIWLLISSHKYFDWM